MNILELLTIENYREWLKSLPEYQSMREVVSEIVGAEDNHRCGCPLEVYLKAKTGRVFIIAFETIRDRETGYKLLTPEWCATLIDIVDADPANLGVYNCWRNFAAKDLLLILDEVETCLAQSV